MGNNKTQGDDSGFTQVLIFAAIVFALLLPAIAFVYIDILSIRAIVQQEVKKSIQLRKQLQKQKAASEESKEND